MRTAFLVPFLVAFVACNARITSVGADDDAGTQPLETSDSGSGEPGSSAADGGSVAHDGAAAGNDGAAAGNDGGTEGSAAGDGAVADGSDTFCTGTSPRLMINGSEVPVLATNGKAIAMNCCSAGELFVGTTMFQATLIFYWRVPASTPLPGTLDLSTLPAGEFEFDLGCDPVTANPSCFGAEERYTSGFVGTVEIANGSNGFDATYCASVAEPAGSPHTTIHELRVYAPHVATNF